jgi:hypothetical protein
MSPPSGASAKNSRRKVNQPASYPACKPKPLHFKNLSPENLAFCNPPSWHQICNLLISNIKNNYCFWSQLCIGTQQHLEKLRLKKRQKENYDGCADRGGNPGLLYIFMGLRPGDQEVVGEKNDLGICHRRPNFPDPPGISGLCASVAGAFLRCPHDRDGLAPNSNVWVVGALNHQTPGGLSLSGI